MKASQPTDHQADNDLDQLEQELARRYSQLGETILDLAEQELRAINRLMADIVKLRQQAATGQGDNHGE